MDNVTPLFLKPRRAAFFAIAFVLASYGGSRTICFAAKVDFAHDIVPIVKKHCGSCHTGDKKQGRFSMNTRAALLAGGESGAAVVVGKSSESELIKRILSDDQDLRMPPEGPRVPADQTQLLKQWIDEGATWEEGFAFRKQAYDPPLLPRRPELPSAVAGRQNPVDRIIDNYLKTNKVEPTGEISDRVFLRRVSLDLIGLLPTPEQVQSFEADRDPAKRTKIVHELLANDLAYAEHWLTFWNDLLRNDYTGTGFITGGRKQITGWLYRSLVENKPYDQFVRELIAPTPEAEGYIQGIRWRGNVSASQTNEIQFAQSICQSFLGINMKCASCHDSFIDRWKLEEAYGLAAIYATEPLAIHRCDKPNGMTATASWLFPELGQIDPKANQPERLKQLAKLMTHRDNGRFTRTIVNRMWHRLMGRGIVHPVDAMQSEPWNQDLLDYLAVNLVDHQFDLKKTMELICTSHAYQSHVVMGAESEESGYIYHGPIAKRMTAEQFVDAVWQVTSSAPTKFDAAVLRAKMSSKSEANASRTGFALEGKWIWSYPEGGTGKPAAGETITVRKQFKLKAVPVKAFAVVTCDNEYTIYVNAQKVAEDGNWESVETISLSTFLKAGPNEILIVAKNAGSAPNPAGLYFEARLQDRDGETQTIATDTSWQWTKDLPDGRGRFKKDPTDWAQAAALPEPTVWTARVGGELAASLAQAVHSPLLMVRASLVKSDALMRTLGRPNRDQIVTMRPNELTTLEAIDLANGQVLFDSISKGASKLLNAEPNSGKAADPARLCDSIYTMALSRLPSSEERAVAMEMIGQPPTQQGVEDLIWSVLMLPEFQMIR